MSDRPGKLDTMKSLFTRFRILNATRALVSEVGVERVTMRRIAALANITAPAIYKHFRNKRALLDAVIASGYTELTGRMARGNRAPSGPRGLRIMTDEVVAFAQDYPRLMQMMLAPRTADDEPVSFLLTQVTRCMRADIMETRNPPATAALIWAQMRGTLSRRTEERNLKPLFDDAMSAVLQPLAAAA